MASCLIKLRQILPDLNKSEKKVADYIVQHPEEVIGLSVANLAAQANASHSAVIRLAKRMNFSGYRDLMLELAKEFSSDREQTPDFVEMRPGDGIGTVANTVCFQNQTAISNTHQILDHGAVQAATDALAAAPRIDIFGIGASLIVAQDAQQKFLRIGKHCNCNSDTHLQMLNAMTLQEKDVGLFISYSGTTMEIIKELETAKQTPATTISITKFGSNPVSDLADINLFISATEPEMRIAAMSSRVAQLTMIDILYTYLVSSNHEHYTGILTNTRRAVQDLKR